MPYATKKGAHRPAHLRSLISAVVVRSLDNMISILVKHKNFKTLPGLCSLAVRFESYLVSNPEGRFSRGSFANIGEATRSIRLNVLQTIHLNDDIWNVTQHYRPSPMHLHVMLPLFPEINDNVASVFFALLYCFICS